MEAPGGHAQQQADARQGAAKVCAGPPAAPPAAPEGNGMHPQVDSDREDEATSEPAETGVDFYCEHDCGFSGAYDEVAAHEKTCGKRPAEDGAGFYCEHECGFYDAYDVVEAHEKTCGKRPAEDGVELEIQLDTASGEAVLAKHTGKIFDCDFNCGFCGSFADVAAHEATCDKRMTIFDCEFDCGFEGFFHVVQAHEQTCDRRPGGPPHDCDWDGGFRASRDEVEKLRCSFCNFEGSTEAVADHSRTYPCAACLTEGCYFKGTPADVMAHRPRCLRLMKEKEKNRRVHPVSTEADDDAVAGWGDELNIYDEIETRPDVVACEEICPANPALAGPNKTKEKEDYKEDDEDSDERRTDPDDRLASSWRHKSLEEARHNRRGQSTDDHSALRGHQLAHGPLGPRPEEKASLLAYVCARARACARVHGSFEGSEASPG